jgi:putative acetyltransferase
MAEIRTMTIDDYDAVLELWRSSDGIGLSGSDSREGIRGYLDRNPGMSLVAVEGADLVGAILAGHDGRRGYIHHLAVRRDLRLGGLGRRLVGTALDRLRGDRIEKCHLFVFARNAEARAFWRRLGWLEREDICMMSMVIAETRKDEGS